MKIIRDVSKESQVKHNINNKNDNIIVDKSEGKKIDKEHVSLEKIFKISLVEKENFLFLKEYSMSLEERNVEKAFRINDLDSIIMSLITSNEKVCI